MLIDKETREHLLFGMLANVPRDLSIEVDVAQFIDWDRAEQLFRSDASWAELRKEITAPAVRAAIAQLPYSA